MNAYDETIPSSPHMLLETKPSVMAKLQYQSKLFLFFGFPPVIEQIMIGFGLNFTPAYSRCLLDEPPLLRVPPPPTNSGAPAPSGLLVLPVHAGPRKEKGMPNGLPSINVNPWEWIKVNIYRGVNN